MSTVSQGINPHPVALALGDTLAMVLVDDQPQATNPIIHGAPDLGWSGDQRMALYYWPKGGRAEASYVLMRLCDDGEYRMICELPAGDRPLSPAGVNLLIRRLIAIDTRRGFDPHTAVLSHNESVENDWRRRNDEWAEEEAAPRLAWAFKRDRGGHLGGSRFDFGGITAPWKSKEHATTEEE